MSHTLVIFGASGDLTSRKLIPALYELFRKKRLPESTKIVGVSRTEFTDNAWRVKLAHSTAEFLPESFDQKIWDKFATSIFYRAGNIDKTESFQRLKTELASIENNIPTDRVYYLSTAPKFYEPAITNLGRSGLVQPATARGGSS